MRNKYKERDKEKQKEDLSSIKPVKLTQNINFKRSKSPGGIMSKMGPLNRFNKILFEKYDKRRENSVKNEINRRKINKYNLDERKERKVNNINSKLKIIRDSSFSKFDNEESIKTKKLEKEEIIKNYTKRNENFVKEKENEGKNKEIKSKIKYTMNYIKKQPQKNIINNINKKIKNIENNKDNNVLKISNVEDFDKPKIKINNEKEINKEKEVILGNEKKKRKKNMNECCSEGNIFKNNENIINNNSPNDFIPKFKNDDILLNKDNSIYDNIRKSPILEKKLIFGKPRQTFQFLVHQAYKNKDLSNSFTKYYESGSRSRKGSKIKNNDEKENNSDNSKKQIFNLMRLPINKNVLNVNEFKITKKTNEEERKAEIRNIKTISLNENNTNHTSSENLPIIKKIIINDNNFNINKSNKSEDNNMNNNSYNFNNNINKENINNKINNSRNENRKIKNYISDNNLKVVINNKKYEKKNEIMKKDYENSSIDSSQSNTSNSNDIELEILYILDKKMRIIINKVNNYQLCENECYNYIQYYFSNDLYNKIIKFFSNKSTKNSISHYIKIELICIFLCYDISFNSYFNQAAILLKTILNIIHTNYLILIYYLINIIMNNSNNYNKNSLKKLIILLESEPSIIQIKNQELNEFGILNILKNNLKNIINYYKMIINNIYGKYNNINEENIKFPKCNKNIELVKMKSNKYKLINIISSFFFDAYKNINNYEFIELQKFFILFLKQNHNKVINSNINNNINNVIYYLPKIKNCYKYSLVLDLDETLIFFQKNYISNNVNNFINSIKSRLVLRPGLIEFLHIIKQFYELILFSSGTCDYVDPIIKVIEKKENFFEFVLYRQHISFDEKGEYYKDLNLLNRNIRNILIVDDMKKNFKFHKLNGICIKPFFGDIQKDANLLNLLGQFLIKIRMDAEETGDIRISLSKEKNSLIYSKIAVKD